MINYNNIVHFKKSSLIFIEDQCPKNLFSGHWYLFQSEVNQNRKYIQYRKHRQSSGEIFHDQTVPHNDSQKKVNPCKNLIPSVSRKLFHHRFYFLQKKHLFVRSISCFLIFHIQSADETPGIRHTLFLLDSGWQPDLGWFAHFTGGTGDIIRL